MMICIFITSWCKVYGIEYRKHLMVVADQTAEEDPVSGTIRHVLVHGETISLLCELCHTSGFDKHYHPYIVQPGRNDM